MSYADESQALVEAAQKNTEAVMAKYHDYKKPPGQLDGEPWDAEMSEISRNFSAELKKLKAKYPDWRSEIES